jgi:hypothetical protein
MQRNKAVFWFCVALIALAVLADEGSTIIYFLVTGSTVGEANPVYLYFGPFWLFAFGAVVYAITIYGLRMAWLKQIDASKPLISALSRYMMVFAVVVMFGLKVSAGYSNMNVVDDYLSNREQVSMEIQQLKDLKSENVSAYREMRLGEYVGFFNSLITYPFMIFVAVFSFLIFGYGHRLVRDDSN